MSFSVIAESSKYAYSSKYGSVLKSLYDMIDNLILKALYKFKNSLKSVDFIIKYVLDDISNVIYVYNIAHDIQDYIINYVNSQALNLYKQIYVPVMKEFLTKFFSKYKFNDVHFVFQIGKDSSGYDKLIFKYIVIDDANIFSHYRFGAQVVADLKNYLKDSHIHYAATLDIVLNNLSIDESLLLMLCKSLNDNKIEFVYTSSLIL